MAMNANQGGEPRPPVLQVDHLKKRIGKRWIVQDMSFEVREGEVFGFLGPNGAGKTTTIRMLVDLIRPTEGSVKVCGYDVNREPERALAFVGSIVENPEVYNYLTGRENLEQFARMVSGVDDARISEVAEQVGLQDRIHDKVKTYSLGMRQRLGIAQALLGRPKLLILDEPTNGLDPKGIKELRLFIRSLAAEGMAVFVSSHLLSEIQLLCDRVAIISRGRLLAEGAVGDLIRANANYVVWELEPRERGQSLLKEAGVAIFNDTGDLLDDAILAGTADNAIVTQMQQEDIPGLIHSMIESGVKVGSVHKINPTLEQLFLEMTDGEAIE